MAAQRGNVVPMAPKKRTRSQVGRHSRNKGKVFEREVARELRAIFGEGVKRGWQAREGHDAADVEGVPGWWVEAKHHARVSIRPALEQATEARAAAKDSRRALAVTKDNRKEAIASLYFEDFLELLRELERLRAKGPAKVEVEKRLVASLELEQPPKEV